MSMMWKAHRAVDRLATLPGVDGFLRSSYERRFAANRGSNLFRGVFDSFEEAEASAPRTRPLGYDNPDAASMYDERSRQVYPADYPVMFWLEKILGGGGRKVVDLGGHVGVTFHAYRSYLEYPADLRWLVQDVPSVVARGRTLAATSGTGPALSFTDDERVNGGADVLLALGSLQYLPDTLSERLRTVEPLPHHLLLNLVPLHGKWSYFTLQSIGTAFCPYQIEADGPFVASIESLGYELVDRWENPEKSCEIPFHPERSLDRYHGLHFRRSRT